MKCGLLMLSMVVALVATAAGQVPRDATPEQDAASRASLRGVVVDERRQAVGGAIVRLRGGPMPGVMTIVTDVKGTFAFAGLPSGSFSLAAWRNGYPPVEYGQTRPFSTGTPIVLGDRQRAAITVRMPRGAVIAGLVLDERGKPLMGQRVSASRALPPADLQEFREWSATTDRSGRYRIAALPAGTYVVTARRISFSYSRGDELQSEAVRVTLPAGEVRGNVDLRVPPLVPVAPVKVTLASAAETPLRSLNVRIVSGDGRQRLGWSCLNDPDGSCTFRDIPRGRHTLVANTKEGAGRWGAVEFTCDGGHPTVVSLALEPGVRIAGRMTFDGISAPPPREQIAIRLIPEGDSVYAETNRVFASARIIGVTFEFPLVPPGRYRLSIAGDPAPWTIESAMHGDLNLLEVPVDVTREGLDGIALVFTDAPTELSGVVRRGSAPRAGVELVAYPTEARLWRSARRIMTTRSDSEGRYTFTGLPPGAYLVAQVPAAVADSPEDAEVLAKLKQLATVTLTRGEHKTRDLLLPASATK